MPRALLLLGSALLFAALTAAIGFGFAPLGTARPFAIPAASTTKSPADKPTDPPATTTPEDPATPPEPPEPPADPKPPAKPVKPVKPGRPSAGKQEQKTDKTAKTRSAKAENFSRLSRSSLRDYEIPLFLLPIYQSCGNQYGVSWTVLASINKVETAFGTNLNVSSAGALGWMQFMPSTWDMYGTDANGDKKKDPYNPVDAICAAARYLQAAGWSEDHRSAIYSYNHADWYVDMVLEGASVYDRLPADLLVALSGLAGAPRYPLSAHSRVRPSENGAQIVSGPEASVVAPNDAKVLRANKKQGDVVLQDDWGNRYFFSGMKNVSLQGIIGPGEWRPPEPRFRKQYEPVTPEALAKRLPHWMNALREQVSGPEKQQTVSRGDRVRAGEKIGDTGVDGKVALAIRPPGQKAPFLHPEPVLEGWKMLEETGFYRRNREDLSPVSAFLLTQEELQSLVLRDDRLDIYSCGRSDIRQGKIDRRVLALLLYLSRRGWDLGITSLQCGHSYYAASGNVSNHSHGGGVDIATINGEPVLGHQQRDSYTMDILRTVLRLQGTMYPDELISLWDLGGASFALPDHDDHIHVGYGDGSERPSGQARNEVIRPDQWNSVIRRLREIDQPRLP